MPGATYIQPRKEHRWYRDQRGRLTDAKRYDEVLVFDTGKLLWDLTDVLESGETVSSATFTANYGLGVSSTGNTTVGVYATITGSGSVEISVVTSEGRTFQEEFYFETTDENASDY